MRVAVYYSNSDVRLEERPRPAIGPGEVLMRVHASGVCGSDVMEWYRKPRAPLVLGHEVAGTVEDVGRGVTGFAPGDRIVTTHHVPCGDCRDCASDRESVCPTLHSTTFDPGGFAEFVRLPALNVQRGTFRLPHEISFAAGSFVEPLACVVRGQRIAGVRAGDTVLVVGSGLSGLLHIQHARAVGAGKVLATDVHPFRLEAARRLGAHEALPAGSDLPRRMRAAAGGRLADRVLVCTGARAAAEQALDLVQDGGAILYFAPLPPGESLTIPAHDLWRRGVSLVHSYAGPPADMAAALNLIRAGKVDVEAMISHRLPLEQAQEAFRLTAAAADSLKVILEP